MTSKRTLAVLFITLLVDMIGVGMIIPIIPIIFTDPTSPSFLLQGYSHQLQYVIAGMITALAGIMTFIASPLLGELSDVYGRKKLLTLCIGILALSQIVFGIGIEISSLTLLFISRAIAGLAGANIAIVQASIADITLPKDRAKNFGLIGAAFGIGFIIGPVMGGLLVALTHNASVPFFTAAVLGIMNLVSISFFLKETHVVPKNKTHTLTLLKAVHNVKKAFTDSDLSTLYTSSFSYMIGFTFFTSITGMYLVQRFTLTSAGLGTYFGVIGIWIVITQGFILRIITKLYNEKQILRFSLVSVALAIGCMPLMPSIIFIYALVPFIAIPQGLSMANMGALISKSAPAEKQGTALGINGSLNALAQGVIPAISGGITALFGLSFPYILASICILFAWRNLFFKGMK